ncbi:cobalamin biosynthesis protein [Kitasatospora sp. NPDC001539]|uniref:cobalamin biosynthesis protein n=1 Tax=Kitasatospora sp. NPDC001539 TaxID=3154384 RepID=UPI00332E8BAD
MIGLIAGGGVRPHAADPPALRVVTRDDPDRGDVLVFPRTLVVGIGAGGGTERTEVLRLLADTLEENGLAGSAVARLATVTGKADHPAVRWAASRLAGVAVDEHPPQLLADVPVPNPSELVGAAVGTASVAEAAALASAPGGRLVVTKRKSATATVAVARAAAVRGRLVVVGLGPAGTTDRLGARALAELRAASAVVGRPEAVEAVAGLLRPEPPRAAAAASAAPTARTAWAAWSAWSASGAVPGAGGRVAPCVGEAVDGTGTAVDHVGAAAALAAHGHAVVLVALGDGAEPAVPPGPYEVHRAPRPATDAARPV